MIKIKIKLRSFSKPFCKLSMAPFKCYHEYLIIVSKVIKSISVTTALGKQKYKDGKFQISGEYVARTGFKN